MSNSLSVDPAELRAAAAKLRQQAEETEQMLQMMQTIIADQGTCWGDDELGETFAKNYEPDSERGVEGFADLVADLRAMSANLENSADEFEKQDRIGAQQVQNSGPATVAGPHTPVSNRPVTQPRATAGPRSGGVPFQQPTAAGRPAAESAAPAPLSSPATTPDAGPGTAPGTAPQQSPGPDRPQDAQQPGSAPTESPGEQPGNPAPQTAPGTPAAPGAATRPQTTPGTPPAARQPGTPAARTSRPPAGPAAESPWTPNRPGPPRPAPRAFPAAGETPPRVSPPQAPPTRPPGRAGTNPDEPPKRSRKRTKPQVAQATNTPSDPEAMRIAREMAARYGLSLAGFETAGLTARTAQDIADAVDIVLVRHPAVLRGIEISEVASSPASVENRGGPAASETVSPWIVLARDAAADPRLLTDRAGPQPGSDPLASRPMYSTVLRQLGSAFDLMGGLRARKEAQRALIAEYLRLHGAQGETLGQVVGGYKRWRAQLGDRCFDRGVLVPARALAEAFLAGETQHDTASGPAKVLHRLLVAMSR